MQEIIKGAETKPDVMVKMDAVYGFMRDMVKTGPEGRAFVEAVIDTMAASIATPSNMQAVEQYRQTQISA